MVASGNIHTLITIGKKAEEIAKQAKLDGSTANIKVFETVNDIGKRLDTIVDDQSLVLIKGPMSSRGMIDFGSH